MSARRAAVGRRRVARPRSASPDAHRRPPAHDERAHRRGRARSADPRVAAPARAGSTTTARASARCATSPTRRAVGRARARSRPSSTAVRGSRPRSNGRSARRTTLNPLEQDSSTRAATPPTGNDAKPSAALAGCACSSPATAIALVLALIGGGIALRQDQPARDQTREADIQRLVGQSARRARHEARPRRCCSRSRPIGGATGSTRGRARRPRSSANRRSSATSAAGKSNVQAVAFTPDGKQLVLGDNDGTITVVDVATHATDRRADPRRRRTRSPRCVATPDGKRSSFGGRRRDGISVVRPRDRASECASCRARPADRQASRSARTVHASRRADTSIAPEQPKVFVWDTQHRGAHRDTVDRSDRRRQPRTTTARIGVGGRVQLDRGCSRSAARPTRSTLFDARTLTPVGRLAGRTRSSSGSSLQFSPDGTRLVSGERARTRGSCSGTSRRASRPGPTPVKAEIFAVTDHRRPRRRLLEPLRERRSRSPPRRPHRSGSRISLQTGSVCDLAVSPDGRTLAVGDCNEPTVALLSLDGRSLDRTDRRGRRGARRVQPRRPAALDRGRARHHDPRRADVSPAVPRTAGYPSAGFTADSKYLHRRAAPTARAASTTSAPVASSPTPRPDRRPGRDHRGRARPEHRATSRSATTTATSSSSTAPAPRSRPRASGSATDARRPDQVHGLSFSPDGKLLAVADQDELTMVFDTTTGEAGRDADPARGQRADQSRREAPRRGRVRRDDRVLRRADAEAARPVMGRKPRRGRSRSRSAATAGCSQPSRSTRAPASSTSTRARGDRVRRSRSRPTPRPRCGPTARRSPSRSTRRGHAAHAGLGRSTRQRGGTAACLEAGRNLTHAEWDKYIGGSYRATCPQWPAAA